MACVCASWLPKPNSHPLHFCWLNFLELVVQCWNLSRKTLLFGWIQGTGCWFGSPQATKRRTPLVLCAILLLSHCTRSLESQKNKLKKCRLPSVWLVERKVTGSRLIEAMCLFLLVVIYCESVIHMELSLQKYRPRANTKKISELSAPPPPAIDHVS